MVEEGERDGCSDGRLTAPAMLVTAEVGADATVVVLECLVEGGVQTVASL